MLVSRKWSGKSLADIGIEKPTEEPRRLTWHKVQPGDPNVSPRAHLLMHAIAERIRWRAEYDKALLAAGELSATQQNAA